MTRGELKAISFESPVSMLARVADDEYDMGAFLAGNAYLGRLL